MEVILHAEEGNYMKLKDKLMADEVVNRASMTFRDAKMYGMKGGYLLIITGTEDRCKHAVDLSKERQNGEEVVLAKEISGGEKEEILRKIKEEEDKAAEGFGNIFG